MYFYCEIVFTYLKFKLGIQCFFWEIYRDFTSCISRNGDGKYQPHEVARTKRFQKRKVL